MPQTLISKDLVFLKNQGYTNKTYKDEQNNFFVKKKNYDEFNHKIDYFILNKLAFSPKTVIDNQQELVTLWINGKTLSENVNPTDSQLKKIAKNLITLHNSKLPFPKENQVARRFKIYRQQIKALNKKIPILDKHYKKINLFLKNIDNSAPVHNDLWLFNMIETKDEIYFVDWEYASMGDVHFDLAYFIEGSNLTSAQEKTFLEAYGDDFEPKYLLAHKIIVNALFVLWNKKHEIDVFDDTLFQEKVEKYIALYDQLYTK
ncbi:phosphotransferase [[Mycoplasma] anseris]|uniref:Aminoglycoside phosphotransferase domain-containing protein n=1 Tax=[Mycoplasma] anseris TaxID=92400 RepID=A0A2Z4NDU7_9BACT|nr:phosphotransferase [[Mycoplasma] anseris]AWX69761.1 hypothetical protein DP065_02525 [[Mycoplasma] anseris]